MYEQTLGSFRLTIGEGDPTNVLRQIRKIQSQLMLSSD